MKILRIQDKIALSAVAITIFIASAIAVVLLVGAPTRVSVTPLGTSIETAEATQEIIVKEAINRCRNKKTGRFIKCP